jgi:coenzyme Q-binding protein COQ10
MPSFSTTRRVKHPASDMFDLVADVEKYPQFVPLCSSLKLIRREQAGEGKEVLVAEMGVAYKVFHESFTSRVTLDKPNLQILVEYLSGPFRSLHNRWTFRPDGEKACEIGFFIDYEFRSAMLGLLMGAVFDAAFRRFAEAFEKRADEVYGQGNGRVSGG